MGFSLFYHTKVSCVCAPCQEYICISKYTLWRGTHPHPLEAAQAHSEPGSNDMRTHGKPQVHTVLRFLGVYSVFLLFSVCLV